MLNVFAIYRVRFEQKGKKFVENTFRFSEQVFIPYDVAWNLGLEPKLMELAPH